MPSLESVERAISELEQEGQSPSIEKVRAIVGGSPRDISRHLQAIRAGTATPAAAATPPLLPPPPVLTLDDVLSMAFFLRLENKGIDQWNLQIYFNNLVDPRLWRDAIWEALLPHASDQERAVIQWYIDTIRNNRPAVSSGGNEFTLLYRAWDRLVVDATPRPTEAERRAHRKQQFVRMARKNRANGRESI